MKGLIFSVRKYSVHDGPGIRVTLFMKGCPLNCLWCHNPEGIWPEPQEVIQTRKVGEKEFSQKETAGTWYVPEDIIKILDGEKVFIGQSHGGVTFSGGEPMHQPEFLLESLKLCKSNGYHTAVDTSGYSSSDNFRAVMPYTDLFLFDIKHLDEARHIELTGASNREIIENFHMLLGSGKEVMVRFPVIPGCNDDNEHLLNLRNFLKESRQPNLKKLCLLPFHRIGESKYRRFSKDYRMNNTEQPSAERMKELKEFFAGTGIRIKIGG